MPSSPASLTQKATSGVAWSAIFQVSRQLLSVLSVSILARHVPPSAYGLIAMAAVLMNFLDTFRDLGTTNALVRETTLTDSLVSTVFWLNCMLGLSTQVALVAVSVPTARFFHEPGLAAVVRALSLVFLINSLAVVPTAMLNREMAFRKINLAGFIGAVAGTTVAITTALHGGGVWSLVFGTLTNNAVNTVACWLFSPCRIRLIFHWKAFQSIASYTLYLSGFNLLNYFSRNADNLIVGRFLGSVPLGFYQMAYNLMTFPLQNFTSVICQVLFPAMARVKEDHARLRAAYIRTCMLIGLFTFPAMLGVAVVAEPFVAVILGKRWLPVAGLLMVFGPVGMLQSVVSTVGLLYNVTGRTDWMFRWGIFSSLLYVASFFIGLPWGIMGVAVSYAVMNVVLLIPCLMIPFHVVQLRLGEFTGKLWPSLRATLLMSILVALWLAGLKRMGVDNGLIQLVSSVAVGIVSYISLLVWPKAPVLRELGSVLEQSGNPIAIRAARYLP